MLFLFSKNFLSLALYIKAFQPINTATNPCMTVTGALLPCLCQLCVVVKMNQECFGG